MFALSCIINTILLFLQGGYDVSFPSSYESILWIFCRDSVCFANVIFVFICLQIHFAKPCLLSLLYNQHHSFISPRWLIKQLNSEEILFLHHQKYFSWGGAHRPAKVRWRRRSCMNLSSFAPPIEIPRGLWRNKNRSARIGSFVPPNLCPKYRSVVTICRQIVAMGDFL